MESNIQVILGKHLKKLRKSKEISCLEFALRAGINKNYYNDLENGKRNPTLEVLERVAKAHKMTLSELLNFEAE